MTAAEWMALAVAQWRTDPPTRQWRDVLAFAELPVEDRDRIEGRINTGLASTDPDVRKLALRVSGDAEAAQWLRVAREQWTADPPARQWRDVVIFAELARHGRNHIEAAIKADLASPAAAVRKLAIRIAGDVTAAEMPNGRALTEHTRLELHAAHWRGRRTGAPVPLEPGAPVPGCGCSRCTSDNSLPEVPGSRSTMDCLTEGSGRPVACTDSTERRTDDCRDPLPVDEARAVLILDVAARLGLDVNRASYALCPFHADSTPSLHINAAKAAAFCNPCARSWDGLALTMELRGLDFPAAVRWLLNLPEPTQQRRAS
jgi:hypothetical protein